MGGFHRGVLRDLGYDVTTVDPNPAAGADHLRLPSRRFDVVCIAAPIEHLADEAAQWVGHEGWLLVEKPFASTLPDARVLAEQFTGQRVAVGYVERFNPQVRRLGELLYREKVESAVFYRHNPRPSPNVGLDLQSHDIDISAFLGLTCSVKYESFAGGGRIRMRMVLLSRRYGADLIVDLMAHDTSPLHAQWHAFLSGRPGYATPADAVHVLRVLELQRLPAAA